MTSLNQDNKTLLERVQEHSNEALLHRGRSADLLSVEKRRPVSASHQRIMALQPPPPASPPPSPPETSRSSWQDPYDSHHDAAAAAAAAVVALAGKRGKGKQQKPSPKAGKR